MKAIIFDIDGVVIISNSQKEEVIKDILQKYNLYNIPWVKEILTLWLNRKLILTRIYEITPFDKEVVLNEINEQYAILESNPLNNDNVINFIKDNYQKYLFFTNTSLPIAWLNRVINALWIGSNFKELLAFENWSKAENIEYVINKYDIEPKDILFIDDNINHIRKVEWTWVNRLHFIDSNIDIEKEIEKY